MWLKNSNCWKLSSLLCLEQSTNRPWNEQSNSCVFALYSVCNPNCFSLLFLLSRLFCLFLCVFCICVHSACYLVFGFMLLIWIVWQFGLLICCSFEVFLAQNVAKRANKMERLRITGYRPIVVEEYELITFRVKCPSDILPVMAAVILWHWNKKYISLWNTTE